MKFHLAKQGNKFIPSGTEDQVKANKISQGEVIHCRSVDQRLGALHRKYFALINLAWMNLPEKFDGYFGTQDDLRKELTKLAGFYDEHKDFHGNTVKQARSIAYDAMSQEDFEKLYSKTVDLVCKLVGIEETEVMNELLSFM